MFQVIRSTNRLQRLKQRRFAELEFREREHLQEWLAHEPEALGEELLIIQKEFDGFADTRERLDLLALDKEGRLVVIENKLDDSGRDVVWQALKYAAYCSTLPQQEIPALYQRYLDRVGEGAVAEEKLREFFDVEDLSEVMLNPRNEQRIMLIAATFRKEVTSAVLWLLGHGVRAQCFSVAPYSFGEEVFIDLRQIIPTPEATDYMIRMAAKDSSEKVVEGARWQTQQVQETFWKRVLEVFRDDDVSHFKNVNAQKSSQIGCGAGVAGCYYALNFVQRDNEVRVLLDVQRPEQRENKWIFDQLEAEKAEVEERFGARLTWRRMDDDKRSRIVFSRQFDCSDESNWAAMAEWLSEHFLRLERAFSEPLARLNQQIKS